MVWANKASRATSLEFLFKVDEKGSHIEMKEVHQDRLCAFALQPECTGMTAANADEHAQAGWRRCPWQHLCLREDHALKNCYSTHLKKPTNSPGMTGARLQTLGFADP